MAKVQPWSGRLMSDRVWISWNEQRRNTGLAAAVGAKLFMTDMDCPGWQRLIREFYSSWKIIKKEKPTICFTMNPSIFASWWLSLISRANNFILVTDLHTPNIQLSGLKGHLFNFFFRSGIRRSDLVIVTNNIYRETILKLNPKVAVVPDPIPQLTGSSDTEEQKSPVNNKLKILFVCSFDPDEPVEEVIALDSDIDGFEISITGNWNKRFEKLPETSNIHFTGFLSTSDYERKLMASDAVLVLTGQEGCLCCGAYEAFSAGKPLIISGTEAIKEYFGDAPLYVDNTSRSILSALEILNGEMSVRGSMIVDRRKELNSKFISAVENLEAMLDRL